MSGYEYDTSWHETMPTELRVGHLLFDVQLMAGGQARESGNYGECCHAEQLIRMNPHMRHQMARDTLLHEALHAIFDLYEIPQDDHSHETACSVLPMALTCFKRDNPEAWAWIFG